MKQFFDSDDDDQDQDHKKTNPIKYYLFDGTYDLDLINLVVDMNLNGGTKKWTPLLQSNTRGKHKQLTNSYLAKFNNDGVSAAALVSVATPASAAAAMAAIFPSTPRNNNNNNTADISPAATAPALRMAPGLGTMAGLCWIMCTDNMLRLASLTPMQTAEQNNNNFLLPPPPPEKKNIIPLDEWKIMEEDTFRKIMEDKNGSVNSNDFNFNFDNPEKSEKYLVLQVMFWMMEVFPPLNTTPFILARGKLQLDKADAELVGLWKSDKAHTFVNLIEEKVDKGVEMNSGNQDNNNKNNIDDHASRSKSNNPKNKKYQKGKQKNFNGEKGTTPEKNALGADKKKEHYQKANKRRKANRQEKSSLNPNAGNNNKTESCTNTKRNGQKASVPPGRLKRPPTQQSQQEKEGKGEENIIQLRSQW